MVNEHEKAIQESERNAACPEYFNARPLLAAERESWRIFDTGFDLGWDAHARQPRNFCGDCGQRTPAGSVHTCSPQSPLARLAAMPSAEKEAVMLRVIDRANAMQQATVNEADRAARAGDAPSHSADRA